MKYKAKKTCYMKNGEDEGRAWIIKNKIYDLKEDLIREYEYFFKSEIDANHSIEAEYLDYYFEKVEDKMEFDLEKIKGKIVHCNTEEKANQLLEFLYNNGYKWNLTGDALIDHNNFSFNNENTCYKIVSDKCVVYGNYNGYDLSDIIIYEDAIIQDKPRICVILGVKVNEKFNIKNQQHNPYMFVDKGIGLHLFNSKNLCADDLLLEIINNPELIQKIPTYTNEQKEIFKALIILGFKYIIRNQYDKKLVAYKIKPFKGRNDYWQADILDTSMCGVKDIFDFIKYTNDNPFEIPTF